MKRVSRETACQLLTLTGNVGATHSLNTFCAAVSLYQTVCSSWCPWRPNRPKHSLATTTESTYRKTSDQRGFEAGGTGTQRWRSHRTGVAKSVPRLGGRLLYARIDACDMDARIRKLDGWCVEHGPSLMIESTMRPEVDSNDFGRFGNYFSRLEFEFCRRGNYFPKTKSGPRTPPLACGSNFTVSSLLAEGLGEGGEGRRARALTRQRQAGARPERRRGNPKQRRNSGVAPTRPRRGRRQRRQPLFFFVCSEFVHTQCDFKCACVVACFHTRVDQMQTQWKEKREIERETTHRYTRTASVSVFFP